MTRRDIIKAVYSISNNSPIIFTTGYTCRDAYDIEDRDSNFYMVGSMGLAASIGLGIAISCPNKTVIVVDGDGSFLMNPNSIFIASEQNVNNYIHIVIDNHLYESTGGQKTYAKNLDFSLIASEVGFTIFHKFYKINEFKNNLQYVLQNNGGPVFYHLIAEPQDNEVTKRISIPLKRMSERMLNLLQVKEAK